VTSEDPKANKEEISIRDYEERDWAAICRVHDRSRPYELEGSCDPRAFVPLEEDTDAANARASRKWVACAGDRVVGFSGIDGTYLSWLYVDPDFHGQGIGRRLLRIGLDAIGPNAWTNALAGNGRALALYQSEGFKITRTFEGNNAGYPCTCHRLELEPPAKAG
jgi:ribosomal protein S18 acetylase RimI-like enzyme